MAINQLLRQYIEWMLEDRLRHATMVYCGYAKDMLEPIEQLLAYSFQAHTRQKWLEAFQTLRTNVAKLDRIADYDEEKYFVLIKKMRQAGASLHLLNEVQRAHQTFMHVMEKDALAPLHEPIEKLTALVELDISTIDDIGLIRQYSAKPIELIDQFDYFIESLHQTEMPQQAFAQLTLLTEQLVAQLAHFNVYELDVLHKPLNGEHMISIGTIPHTIAPHVAAQHVCKVFERGFYIKHTHVVLREAKVMTVM
ncbi:nucleotide exchange factor GrpE [Kurthia massiliensis]|uniref:nucleotide exchange factor GrpE n=1 Tax=Kurthia massiliensis TaxID=1033739 RepID=UPI0002889AF0|nr:nucleotide exchange factor GrpE [Kurthia massiliensis]